MSRSRLVSLVRNLLRRDTVEKALDEEGRSYVDLLADEKAAAGLPEQAARRAARIETGGLEQLREAIRDQRAGAVLEHFVQDACYGGEDAVTQTTRTPALPPRLL